MNSPTNTTVTTIYVAQYVGYVSVGLFAFSTNLIILLAVLPVKDLRSKYILQLALAAGDSIYGLAYLIGGSYRLHFVLNGSYMALVSRWECLERPYVMLSLFGETLPVTITTIIALERFLAVSCPVAFALKWPIRRISALAVAVTFLSHVVVVVAAFVELFSDSLSLVPTFCMLNMVLGVHFTSFKITFCIICVNLSIGISLATIIAMKVQGRRLKNDSIAKRHLKRELRLTKTMLLVIILLVIFVLVPYGIDTSILFLNCSFKAYEIVTPWFWMAHCANAGINIFIYTARNPDLRTAFINFFTFRCLCSRI